jgi:ribose transport system substrate-binding protein
MRLHRIATTLMVGLLLSAIPACSGGSGEGQGTGGGPSGNGPIRVGFVSNNPATFWTIVEAGCRKAEKETGAEVYFRKPSTGDPAEQTRIIRSLLNQEMKAIAVSVINPTGQRDFLNEIAARVPLITQDNDAPDSKRLCYIGTNNYTAGRAVGRLVKEAMPEGGTIAIFVGQLEPLNARQRRQGVLDELAGTDPPADINEFENAPDKGPFGKFRLHGTFTDQPVGEQKATQNANAVLTTLSEEKNLCLIGLWAYNPPAILTAVRDKERLGQVRIVGFDEDFATLQGIADGHIHATVVQDPFNFGYEGVKLLVALARGDLSVLPKDGIRYVPHRVITKDGGTGRLAVGPFRTELEAILGKK